MELIVTDTRVKNKYTDQVIVATNKPSFFREYANDSVKIESLQGDEWLPTQDVWKMLDRYNQKVTDLMGKEGWKYEEGYHIEGAGLSQVCADMILLQHIYNNIFNKYEINKVNIYISQSNLSEALIALNMAKNRKLPVHVHYNDIEIWLKAMVNPVARVLMILYMNIRRIKRFWDLRRKKACSDTMVQYDVGIYIGSNAAKHYNWSLDLIRNISKKIRRYTVISVDKGYVYQECKKAGYEVIVLGEKIDKRYLKGIKKEYRVYRKKSADLMHLNWEVEGESFSDYMRRQICINTQWRMTDTLCKVIQVESILCNHGFCFMRAHGSGEFIETRAFFYFSKTLGNGMKLFRADDRSLGFPELLGKNEDIIKLRYVEKASMLADELKRYDVEVVELPHSAYTYREDVKFNVKCNANSKHVKMLWSPSYVLRGYGSKKTFAQNNEDIMELVQNSTNVELYVKYHPNQDDSEVYGYKRRFKQIYFYDKQVFIGDCINDVDIIITDTSSLILDAMVAQKPVIAILAGPNEQRFVSKIMKYLRTYDSVQSFFCDLNSHLDSNDSLNSWLNAMVEKQNAYFICEDGNKKSKAELVAEDLVTRLKYVER